MTEDQQFSFAEILSIVNSIVIAFSIIFIITIKYIKSSSCWGNNIVMRSGSDVQRVVTADPNPRFPVGTVTDMISPSTSTVSVVKKPEDAV